MPNIQLTPWAINEPIVAQDAPGRSRVVIGLLVGLATCCLGALRVGDEALWIDETTTATVIDRSWGGLMAVLHDQEAAMAPYFVALWCWRHLWSTESGLRMFSVLGSALALAGLFVVADRWFGRRVGLVAVVLCITNPFFLRYLTELRAYSWTIALGIWFVWALDRSRERPGIGPALLVGVLAGLGVAIHLLFVLFALPVLVVSWGVEGRRIMSPRHAAAAATLAVALVAPTIPAMRARSGQIDWIGETTPTRIVSQGRLFLGGTTTTVLLAVGIVAALAPVVKAVVRRKGIDYRLAVTITAMVAMPVLVVAVSFVKPVLLWRYLAPAFPFAALTAAVGYESLARRPRGPTWLAFVVPGAVAISLFLLAGPFTDEDRDADPRAAAEFVDQRLEPGDIIAVDGAAEQLLYYFGVRPNVMPGLAEPPSDDRLRVRFDPIGSYMDALEAADRVFVMRWSPAAVEDALADFAAEHDLERHPFGRIEVWMID